MRVTAEYIHILSRFLADPAMEAMSCVRIEPHPAGAVLLALDGHNMAVFIDRHAAGVTEPINVQLFKPLAAACKAAKVGGDKFLCIEGGRVSVANMAGVPSYVEPVDILRPGWLYPDWRPFFRRAKQQQRERNFGEVAFKSEDLPAFLGMRRGQGSIRFYGNGEAGMPVYVKVSGLPEFVGIIMPTVPAYEDQKGEPGPFYSDSLAEWAEQPAESEDGF